jgi:hypothetical protein
VAVGLLAGAATIAVPVVAGAAPPDDRILPVSQHTSEKARLLATRHARALRDLNAEVYHCLPWLEVQKNSIGFYKPRGATADTRFLSIRFYIEQEPSPQFAALSAEQRASAMFSRYVGHMLRRMTRNPAVINDDAIEGFTVIAEWLKQIPAAAGQRPVHETMAVFVDKVDADDYLAGRTGIRELASRVRILGFDGETALGSLRVSAWDDDFASTYKIRGYQLDPGVTCTF